MAARTLRVGYDIDLLPKPNEVCLVLDDRLPPPELVTSALALAFDGDRLLMTHLRHRGWDLPGGHIETGEAPEEAMRREVYEETGARLGAARMLGYELLRVLAPRPDRYGYPYPDSYQIFYVARVATLAPFDGSAETSRRALFAPAQAHRLRWVQNNLPLYDAARRQVSLLSQ